MKRGRIITLIGNTNSGKTEATKEMIGKRLYCYNQSVLYLGKNNPFSKYEMSNRNLTVSIYDEIDNHSKLIDIELIKHLEAGASINTVALDFASLQSELTREDVVKLRYYANVFDIDIIISLQSEQLDTSNKSNENSHIYNFSDIVIYPNKGVSGRIDIPKESSVDISRLINLL